MTPPIDLQVTLRSISSAATLVNYICAMFGYSTEEKQRLLAIDSVSERATTLLSLLEKEREMLELKEDIRRI